MGLFSGLFGRESASPAAGSRKPMPVPEKHYVLGTPLKTVPEGMRVAVFGGGCFWGLERRFFQTPGVYSTAVGYAGGSLPDPTYYEVCSGRTGHAEVVRVVYDPQKVDYLTLLDVFWSAHDPTQLNRQGNDVGTQYRSVIIYADDEQKRLAEATRAAFDKTLRENGYGRIVTELLPAADNPFYFAEEYHQQYLAKNPGGYCGLGGTRLYNPEAIRSALKEMEAAAAAAAAAARE
jgi:peptide-methionine (S)-S-oxide reductase